jgi:hypothetical protein
VNLWGKKVARDTGQQQKLNLLQRTPNVHSLPLVPVFIIGKFGQVIHGMSQRSLERLYLEEDHFVTHVIALFYPLEILSGYKMIDRA